jgi:hypothetical protein
VFGSKKEEKKGPSTRTREATPPDGQQGQNRPRKMGLPTRTSQAAARRSQQGPNAAAEQVAARGSQKGLDAAAAQWASGPRRGPGTLNRARRRRSGVGARWLSRSITASQENMRMVKVHIAPLALSE